MRENEFNIIPFEQRSQEWHSFREGKIGASQAGTILGLNKYQTPLSLWEEIVLGTEKKLTSDMSRGIKLESEALEWFNKHYGGIGQYFYPIVVQSKKHPSLIASLDGWDGIYPLEIKCPRIFSLELSPTYYAQLQHQMFVTGSNSCWYVEYCDGFGKAQQIARNENFITNMVEKELEFLDSIINLQPPKPSDEDWIEMKDQESYALAASYRLMKENIEYFQKEMEIVKSKLINKSSHPRLRIGYMSLQKVVRKGAIDYEKMMDDYNITNPEKYHKEPIEMWRLT